MKKSITLGMLFLCTISTACPLSVRIPALDRVRKNVENALHDGTKLIAVQANKLVTALGLGQKNDTLEDVKKILDSLKWSQQDELARTLVKLKSESVAQATSFLKDIIKIQCASSRMPLVTFAQELAHEEQLLNQSFGMILKCLSDKQKVHGTKSDEVACSIKAQSDRHTQFLQTLHQLIDITNELLML